MTTIGENYLAQIEFKKRRIGGVDVEDVVSHFETLTQLYEQELAQNVAAYSQQLYQRDMQIRQMQQQYADAMQQAAAAQDEAVRIASEQRAEADERDRSLAACEEYLPAIWDCVSRMERIFSVRVPDMPPR